MNKKIGNFLKLTRTYAKIKIHKNFRFFFGIGTTCILAYGGAHQLVSIDYSKSAESIAFNALVGSVLIAIVPVSLWLDRKHQKNKLTSPEFIEKDTVLKEQLAREKEMLTIHETKSELEAAIVASPSSTKRTHKI